MKKVSIVIPTLNEEELIGNLLIKLKIQTLPSYEIIIVDAKSTDKTKEIVYKNKSKNIYFYETIAGIAHQRNFGANKAKGEIIIFLDADVFPEKDFIKKLVSVFTSSKIELACPLFYPKEFNIFTFAIYLFFDLMFILFQKIVPSGAGTCLIINKKTFIKSGGFNTSFKFEDIELIRRLSKKVKFAIIPIFLKTSDRRFRSYGVISTLLKYILLSFLFIFGFFKLANKIGYNFGKYRK